MKSRLPFLLFVLLLGSWPSRAEIDKDAQADILMLGLPASAYVLTLRKSDEEGAWMLTKSLGLTALSTLALNSIIDQNAPNRTSSDAFPSGHTAVAFSSAAFLQRRYGWRPGIPAYLAASYVGYLRIETDDHDLADVAAGAAVGMVSSYLLTKPFDDTIRVSASLHRNSAELRIQFRW